MMVPVHVHYTETLLRVSFSKDHEAVGAACVLVDRLLDYKNYGLADSFVISGIGESNFNRTYLLL